jgi:thiol-disulfide isomerase/thioredoxin
VLLLGGIMVNLLTKDDKSGASGGPVSVSQVRPVTVDGAALPSFTGDPDDPAVGTTAPTVEGASFDGTAESIGGKTEKPTLIMFVAHWCPHCQREVPRVVQWRTDGVVPENVNLVIVSTSVTPERGNYPASTWLSDAGWTGPLMADDASSTAALAYGLSSFPYFVALDADGTVVARGSGELDQAAVEDLVRQLQAA